MEGPFWERAESVQDELEGATAEWVYQNAE